MNRILSQTFGIISEFVVNQFWTSWKILVLLLLSLILNGFLWYFYIIKIKDNPVPFVFASGLIGLNMILANFLYNRDRIASFSLLAISLFVQILMFVFLRYLTLTF